MNPSPGYTFAAQAIATMIVEWAAIKNPSYDPPAVNRVMDLAETHMREPGAEVERVSCGHDASD